MSSYALLWVALAQPYAILATAIVRGSFGLWRPR